LSRLEEIHREIDACEVCKSSGYRIEKAAGVRRGGLGASVMAVGIAPSVAARQAKKALAGNSFNRLLRWFAAAGFPATEDQLRDAVYLTSLNKCAVLPDTESNRRGLWKSCQQFLWRQIDIVRPKLILLLGKEPAAMVLADPHIRLGAVAGRSWTTRELFVEELFPPTGVSATWLILPHPSGLSRLMNDDATSGRIIAALHEHLGRIGFEVTLRSKERP
jgi:DNA polymerase